MFRLDEDKVYRSELLDRFPWLEHGFGTRLSSGWPEMSRVVSPKQVHSNRVISVPEGAPTGATARIAEGDALITDQPDMLVAVRTADCLPILLVDAITRRVGAIHAGWRGTVARISAATVHSMCKSGCRPADIRAAIGPGIGACCFEVGPEVGLRFAEIFPERVDLSHHTHIDLAEANRRQLLDTGVLPEHIDVSGLCTVCRGDVFHSFRRDRERAGRMLSVAGFRGG